jgi:hypothetical protein
MKATYFPTALTPYETSLILGIHVSIKLYNSSSVIMIFFPTAIVVFQQFSHVSFVYDVQGSAILRECPMI